MKQEFFIRTASLIDADELGRVGRAVYAEVYGQMWRDREALARHLDSFAGTSMSAFIARPDTKCWLVEKEGRILGFLTLVLDSPDPVAGRPGGTEVQRIYLMAEARREGLGRKLLRKAESYACEKQAKYIWLDAMSKAPWAWKTYLGWGLVEIGETTFPGNVLPGCKRMMVMRRDL